MKYFPQGQHGTYAFVLIVICAIAASCSQDPFPKPRGYFRIDLPEKEHTTYRSDCPFEMEVPRYGRIEQNRGERGGDSCWFNFVYPALRAKIHFTYLPIRGNSDALVRDAYTFAARHEMKATAIRRTLIEDPKRDVFGVIYDIEGEAASQVQFFLMDSVRHFVRGALYFSSKPNADSLAPVLSYIRKDIVHMAQTIQWEKGKP